MLMYLCVHLYISTAFDWKWQAIFLTTFFFLQVLKFIFPGRTFSDEKADGIGMHWENGKEEIFTQSSQRVLEILTLCYLKPNELLEV